MVHGNDQICYDGIARIGCIVNDVIDNTKPIVSSDNQEVQNVIEDTIDHLYNPDVQNFTVNIYLFTRDNRTERQVLDYDSCDEQIWNSSFNSERKTKFIIHGYMSGYEENGWMGVSNLPND